MSIRRFIRGVALSFAVLLATVSQAHATTVGDTIDLLTGNFATIPTILSSVSYIMGCFYAAWGIFKFKDHVDNPSGTPMSAGVKRFFGGGMLFALPYMAEVVKGTLFPGAAVLTTGTSRNLDTYAPCGMTCSMDGMIVTLIQDIAGPMTMLLTSFSYISGLLLLLVGISRMIKTAQEGPRGPAGLGTVMTLFVSGALLSGSSMISAFTTSFFGDAQVHTFARISPTIITSAADRTAIGAVVEALMTFIMIVGIIAFIRGLFVLRAFAEGSQSATVMQAMTFLFGGALAINLGDLVNVLGVTVGVTGLQFT